MTYSQAHVRHRRARCAAGEARHARIDTVGGQIAPWTAWAFGVLLVLADAAAIDGCGSRGVLRSICLPKMRPAVVVWPALIAANPARRPVEVGLETFVSNNGIDQPLEPAWAIVGVVPVILLFIRLQRYMVESVARRGRSGGESGACGMIEASGYLNTANVGLAPALQVEAARRFVAAKAKGSGGEEEWRANAELVEARLRRLVGPMDLRFFGNTTSALLAVAHGVEWRPDDEVLVRENDFPSVVQAWGDRARRVPDTAALLSAIGPRTRLVAASHVDWATGERLDLSALGRRCREVGALLCVDGVQAAGAIPLDLEYVDFYAVAPFKWLLGWFGLAFLAVRPGAALRGPDYAGHMNHPALFVLHDTLAWLQDEVGMEEIYAQVAHLAAATAEGLKARGRTVITPAARAGIVSFADPDAEATVARLAAQGIQVSARRGGVRVSPHFYNTEADVDRLLRAL